MENNEKRFILRFIGKKAELHQQLKVWCVQSRQTMNGKIIELIDKFLKEK